MANTEAERSPAEQALITDATNSVVDSIIEAVGSRRHAVSQRCFPYTVTYHLDGSFGINSSNVNVFFHPRDIIGQQGQREMAREILSVDGRQVLCERTLKLKELQRLSRIVAFPNQEVDRLVELSDEECSEAAGRQAEIALEATELEEEAQARVNARNAAGLLHTVSVIRPASEI
ncbi:MAG TPA: hypothetical protein VMR77_03005 [Patescibacteria group bacterium]|jgi:hypothetical protein|nr:hypothetical protein [Patescibacteria group bacterium]